MIRVGLTHTGAIIIENTPLPQPTPPLPPVAKGTLGTAELRFVAGVDEGEFGGILYTFEDWQYVYPLQSWEAVGQTAPVSPFALDPVPLSHPSSVRLDVPSISEVAFAAQKLPDTNTVELTATKPGVVTKVTIDDARPSFSVALFVGEGQHAYVRFETWPGLKKGKRFRFPPK